LGIDRERGCGPVGVELGQFMRRFGARVTIIEHGERLLAREDAAVGELISQALRDEGIELRLGAKAVAVSLREGNRVVRLEGTMSRALLNFAVTIRG